MEVPMKRLFALVPVLLLAAPVHAQLRTTSISELETLVKSLQSQVSSLAQQTTQLQQQVTTLQNQVNNTVGFTKSGNNYTLNAGTGAVVIKGYTLNLEGTTSASIKSTSTTVEGLTLLLKSSSSAALQAGTTLDLKGSLIKLNNGGKPVLAQPAVGVALPTGLVNIKPQVTTVYVP
jgi:hypothetical protein